ncbi:MAG: hypothetical protein V4543_01270 [Bacteroidota bacterium]
MNARFYLSFAIILITGQNFSAGAQAGAALPQLVKRLDAATTEAEYKSLAGEFSKEAEKYKNNWLCAYYTGYCHAAAGFLLNKDGDKVIPYNKAAEEYALKALALTDTAHKYELSEVYSLMSMAYRTHIFISPFRYGKKYSELSDEYIAKAKKANPLNPRALYLEGTDYYFTPRLFGGNKDKGIGILKKALPLFSSKPVNSTYPRWGKRECEQVIKMADE